MNDKTLSQAPNSVCLSQKTISEPSKANKKKIVKQNQAKNNHN
jgi:hypothetical protein